MNKNDLQVVFSKSSSEWRTPLDLFNKLNREFHFTLDPCSTHENALCEKHYTKEENGLSQSWENDIVFVNPPNEKNSISLWIQKAYEESLKGATVVCLVPARTDTLYWHDWIFGKASDIRFIKGRLKFSESTSPAPFPSAVIVFKSKSKAGALIAHKFVNNAV